MLFCNGSFRVNPRCLLYLFPKDDLAVLSICLVASCGSYSLLPVAVILYGLVIVVIYLCRCRWQLFLKNVVIVAVELVILLAAFFSMAILCAIYNDDDGVEQLPTLSMTVND